MCVGSLDHLDNCNSLPRLIHHCSMYISVYLFRYCSTYYHPEYVPHFYRWTLTHQQSGLNIGQIYQAVISDVSEIQL